MESKFTLGGKVKVSENIFPDSTDPADKRWRGTVGFVMTVLNDGLYEVTHPEGGFRLFSADQLALVE